MIWPPIAPSLTNRWPFPFLSAPRPRLVVNEDVVLELAAQVEESKLAMVFSDMDLGSLRVVLGVAFAEVLLDMAAVSDEAPDLSTAGDLPGQLGTWCGMPVFQAGEGWPPFVVSVQALNPGAPLLPAPAHPPGVAAPSGLLAPLSSLGDAMTPHPNRPRLTVRAVLYVPDEDPRELAIHRRTTSIKLSTRKGGTGTYTRRTAEGVEPAVFHLEGQP